MKCHPEYKQCGKNPLAQPAVSDGELTLLKLTRPLLVGRAAHWQSLTSAVGLETAYWTTRRQTSNHRPLRLGEEKKKKEQTTG